MKKICLITYTRSPNYGAALQLFATYKALEMLGCDVTVLDYQNVFEARKKGVKFVLSGPTIKEIAREYISSYVFGVKRNAKRNFDGFYNTMKYSRPVTTVDELEGIGKFDIFCVGSDQVWNPRITNGYDDVFILNKNLSGRKISYASSMGSYVSKEYSDNDFIKAIEDFDRVSVREEIAQKYLCARITKSVKKVVDPTLLIGEDGWNRIIKENNICFKSDEKYVLVYALGGYFDKNRVVAEKIADMIGAKVYAITLSNRKKNTDKIITDATPFDFVRLIRDASFVVTNSFHGTCFSMMMKTPFYSVRYGDNPARAEELLTTYGLENRMIIDDNSLSDRLLCNDDLVNATKRIEQHVFDSVEWLRQAVSW